MSWHSILFNLLLVGCCSYALLRGGMPERLCALIFIAGTMLTAIALAPLHALYEIEGTVFAVDAVAFAAFTIVALLANRHWPLVVSGMQGSALLIHVAKLVVPTIPPMGYQIGLQVWGYPMLVVIGVGTWRHRKRLALYGRDGAWSRWSRAC